MDLPAGQQTLHLTSDSVFVDLLANPSVRSVPNIEESNNRGMSRELQLSVSSVIGEDDIVMRVSVTAN